LEHNEFGPHDPADDEALRGLLFEFLKDETVEGRILTDIKKRGRLFRNYAYEVLSQIQLSLRSRDGGTLGKSMAKNVWSRLSEIPFEDATEEQLASAERKISELRKPVWNVQFD
jgi:hypothetical protein